MTDTARKVQLPTQGASEPSRELPQGSLNPRRMRRIIAEYATWNEDRIKPLVQLCLDAVVANFKNQPVQDLPKEYQKKVLDALPATLPLEMAVKMIDDEGYWERAAKVFARTKDITKHGGSWKRLYFERYIAALVESFVPGSSSDEPLLRALALAQPYVVSLDLQQLQPPALLLASNVLPQHAMPVGVSVGDTHASTLIGLLDDTSLASTKASRPVSGMRTKTSSLQSPRNSATPAKTNGGDGNGDGDGDVDGDDDLDAEEDPVCDHVDLSVVAEQLPCLERLNVCYKMDNCGMRFNWSLFGMTTADADLLGDCVRYSPKLHTLIVQKSMMNDKDTRRLALKMMDNKVLKTLDLAHNEISDRGVRGLAKVLNGHCVVETLTLCDNQIGFKGAQALAHALKGNSVLTTLDLRLNNIGDNGATILFTALTHNRALKRLNVSSNGITESAVAAIGECLEQNQALSHLDITCNELGDPAGKKLLDAIDHNSTLLSMDMRLTGFSQETEIAINEILTTNLHRLAHQSS